MNKITTTFLVIIALGLGILVGHSFWKPEITAGFGINNPQGSTFSTQPVAEAEVFTSNTAGTSTIVSLLNTSTTDRFITDIFCYANNWVGNNPSILIQAATSTAPSGINGSGFATSSNLIASQFLNASSTAGGVNFFFTSLSSTTPLSGSFGTSIGTTSAVWLGGSYINFVTNNLLMTGSGACGVDYLGT